MAEQDVLEIKSKNVIDNLFMNVEKLEISNCGTFTFCDEYEESVPPFSQRIVFTPRNNLQN